MSPFPSFNSSGSLTMRYLNGPAGDIVDAVLARQSAGGTVAWYLPDRLGTIRDLINNSASIIDHVDYSAFGTVLDESSPSNGDRMMGFAGMERDTVTGLNLAVHRIQDPATGRWTSEDPLGFTAGDPNLERYVGNDPSNLVDPSGRDGWGRFWWGIRWGTCRGGRWVLDRSGYRVFRGTARNYNWRGNWWHNRTNRRAAIGGGINGYGQTGFMPGTTGGLVPGAIFAGGGGAIGGAVALGATAVPAWAAGAGTAGSSVLVRPGGLLDQVLSRLNYAFYTNPPSTAMEGLNLVNEVTTGLGLQPGVLTNIGQLSSGGPAILQNVGRVVTYILPNGSIIIAKGGQVITWLNSN